MQEDTLKRCLVLYSGGLDSILACKVLQEQGLDVLALKFITPFFSYELKDEEKARQYVLDTKSKYGIDVRVLDITDEYLNMLVDPPHGYGRYLNPCIDCKILMVKKALGLLNRFNASFIATGEVLGQRPMSQRRDTLRIIERDSGADGVLLRPLSAAFLKETLAEKKGLVDRDKLPKITGRSRKAQIELARAYGIKDYPSPAGGCVLADPILSKRFRKLIEKWPDFTPNDCVVAQVGRHFLLTGGSWLIVGRNKSENEKLKTLVQEDDLTLRAVNIPGPFSILRYLRLDSDLRLACQIVARYTKGKKVPAKIEARRRSDDFRQIFSISDILPDTQIQRLMF